MTSSSLHSSEATVEPLTHRARNTLARLAVGLSAAEIAQMLSLAVSLVKRYVQQRYSKLSVN